MLFSVVDVWTTLLLLLVLLPSCFEVCEKEYRHPNDIMRKVRILFMNDILLEVFLCYKGKKNN